MVQANGHQSVIAARTQRQAVSELAARGDPMRMYEAVLNLDLGPEWICKNLKKIAEEGGSLAQIKAIEMVAGVFVEARAMTVADIVNNTKTDIRGVRQAVAQAIVLRKEEQLHDDEG